MTPVISIKTGKKLDSYELWQMERYGNILPTSSRGQMERLVEWLLSKINNNQKPCNPLSR